MTDDEAKALGLRAVACSGWRWLPGMLARADSHPAIRLCEEVILFVWRAWPPFENGAAFCLQGDAWPDLRNPATMGAAVALWQAHPSHDYRCPCPVLTYAACYGLTDRRTAEALVAALEAAPARVSP
jgi:hypothetical protein